jgi:hypothetical protein
MGTKAWAIWFSVARSHRAATGRCVHERSHGEKRQLFLETSSQRFDTSRARVFTEAVYGSPRSYFRRSVHRHRPPRRHVSVRLALNAAFNSVL